jgi:hypothetical protein
MRAYTQHTFSHERKIGLVREEAVASTRKDMRMRYCELCSNLLNVFGFQQWRKSAQSWEDADFLHANKIEGLFRFGSLLPHHTWNKTRPRF